MEKIKTRYIPGFKKGLLTVTKIVGRHGRGIWVEVLCECGTKKKIYTATLSDNHKSISCGCVGKEKSYTDRGQASWKNLFHRYRSNSGHRGISFLLTFEEFKEICSKNCNYCGSEPVPFNTYLNSKGESIRIKSRKKEKRIYKQETIDRAWIKANGIDRIDSLIGYLANNIVPCCAQCNLMKNDYSKDSFLSHVNKIFNFMNKKD